MKIKLLFFAQVRERMGAGERTAEIADGASASDVAQSMRLSDLPLLFAVNERMVEPQHPLVENDVLAFLVPVSGGAA